jgi:hypothetical protein
MSDLEGWMPNDKIHKSNMEYFAAAQGTRLIAELWFFGSKL